MKNGVIGGGFQRFSEKDSGGVKNQIKTIFRLVRKRSDFIKMFIRYKGHFPIGYMGSVFPVPKIMAIPCSDTNQ